MHTLPSVFPSYFPIHVEDSENSKDNEGSQPISPTVDIEPAPSPISTYSCATQDPNAKNSSAADRFTDNDEDELVERRVDWSDYFTLPFESVEKLLEYVPLASTVSSEYCYGEGHSKPLSRRDSQCTIESEGSTPSWASAIRRESIAGIAPLSFVKRPSVEEASSPKRYLNISATSSSNEPSLFSSFETLRSEQRRIYISSKLYNRYRYRGESSLRDQYRKQAVNPVQRVPTPKFNHTISSVSTHSVNDYSASPSTIHHTDPILYSSAIPTFLTSPVLDSGPRTDMYCFTKSFTPLVYLPLTVPSSSPDPDKTGTIPCLSTPHILSSPIYPRDNIILRRFARQCESCGCAVDGVCRRCTHMLNRNCGCKFRRQVRGWVCRQCDARCKWKLSNILRKNTRAVNEMSSMEGVTRGGGSETEHQYRKSQYYSAVNKLDGELDLVCWNQTCSKCGLTTDLQHGSGKWRVWIWEDIWLADGEFSNTV